jgi:TonB family protein
MELVEVNDVGVSPGDDDDAAEVMAPFEAPRDAAAPPRPVRMWSRRSTGISLALSLALHAGVIVVLVKAGVLRLPASVSLQGGLIGAPGVEGVGDTAMATRGQAEAPLPDAVAADPAPVELPTGEILAMAGEWPADVSSKTPAQRLDAGEAALIGLAGIGPAVDLSVQFGHRYPAAWRGGNAGAGATEPVSAASSVARGGGGEGGNGGDGGGGRPVASAHNKRPAYPAEARRKKFEGTVWLLIEIKEDGSIGAVTVDESSGYEILDQAAVDAVRTWHFTPAMEDGRPVRSTPRQPIVFSLHG